MMKDALLSAGDFLLAVKTVLGQHLGELMEKHLLFESIDQIQIKMYKMKCD